MVTDDDIKKWKAAGQVIVTSSTFKKSVEFVNEGDKTTYRYRGVDYSRHDWLLTYSHAQYERLTI